VLGRALTIAAATALVCPAAVLAHEDATATRAAAMDDPVAALSDAELVTVTEHGFVATWTTPTASDTTVCVGGRPTDLSCKRQESTTGFHRAAVGGLRSGRRYFYSLQSAGVPQPLSQINPGSFKTLVPPPGRHLFDFAVLADNHVGEGCSGTALGAPQPVGSVPPCFRSNPPDPPYAATMAAAAVSEINASLVGLTIINADSTSHADHEQASEARHLFDRLTSPYRLTRGSHDRANQNPADARCGPGNDCFRAVFFPRRPPGRIYYSFNHRGYHFVVLDSASPGDGTGDLTDAGQRAFLVRDLERAKGRNQKTFIVFHHPVSEYSTTFAVPPVIFGVRRDRGGADFLQLMKRFPNVVGVLNSHTHRNFVSYSPETGARLPYIESGPTKEYPGGYSIFKVYEGGYTRSFHRLACSFCRRWTHTTRGEYFGLYPLYTLGTLSARNFSHLYGCSVQTPPQSLITNESVIDADTGSGLCPRRQAGRTITGTPGNDRLIGTPGNDVIICGDGDDYVRAGAGDDYIDCGAGDDTINAGAGNDRVLGRSGNDFIRGVSGRDRINGGSDKDRLGGGSGRDRIAGRQDNDRVNGNSGRDFITGGSRNDRISGGTGADRIRGGTGKDRVSGGSGGDRIRGQRGRDRLRGGGGNDRLYGGAGNDRLGGGRGRDRLFGGPGRDFLFGGSGNDRLAGGSGGDVLFGGRGRDRLFGGPGLDRLFGGPGRDRPR
jgi:3',5'-cyclic-AMP phosphodiesterase